jgi:deazaflavin-dependent oxidoreductase (nitroreductase family)
LNPRPAVYAAGREGGSLRNKGAEFRPPPSRLIKFLYRTDLAPLIGRLVLLLTTTGRKTGLPRVTPLQYEELDGVFYVGSARGARADWFRNIVADPCVQVRIKSREFEALAEPVTDPCRIADFLELRLRRHPRMIGAIMRSEGLPASPTRAELEEYAHRSAMVIIRPKYQPP